MKKSGIIFLVFYLFFLSCRKKDDTTPPTTVDTTAPVVTLTSPDDSSVFYTGDTVFIQGHVTDNDMHDGTIEIIDDTTSFVYYNQDHYVHALQYANISFYYVVNVTQPSAVTLSATYIDHHPNSGTAIRHLTFLP